jgi:hypothetical protein
MRGAEAKEGEEDRVRVGGIVYERGSALSHTAWMGIQGLWGELSPAAARKGTSSLSLAIRRCTLIPGASAVEDSIGKVGT